MPTVLFVVSIVNYHREVLPVIKNFAQNNWRVVVLIGWTGSTADDAVAEYLALGCAVERLPRSMCYAGETSRTAETPADRKKATKPKHRLAFVRRLIGILRQVQLMLVVKRWTFQFMDRVKPHIVFSGPFHSIGKFDNAFLLASRRQHTPHCCYSFSPYHGRTNAINARFDNLSAGMLPQILRTNYDWLNRLLARCFPEWTATRDKVTIFMSDPVLMLAGWLTEMMNRDVWETPSSSFEIVFVFGEFSRKLLEIDGFPMDHVMAAGIPLLDTVIEEMQDPTSSNRIKTELGLREDQPYILFNVEPSAEHHYCAWEDHWRSFRNLMGIMSKQKLAVVLSLHPLCSLENYLFAEQEFGVVIARERKIYDLYPHCQFAVSFPCSTNLLADMFNKGLVIYDFFGVTHPSSPRASWFSPPGAVIGSTLFEVEQSLSQIEKSPRPGLGFCGNAVSSALTFMPASEAIRTRVESMLNDTKTRITVI